MIVQISVCVRRFSVNINSNGAVISRTLGIQESESSLAFLFCRKRDVWVDRIEEIVKCRHCVRFDDREDVINKAFQFSWRRR